ncbi:MAG: hypothetical protein HY900_00360 [Deltaproteobacteria bacterium]|nr:hypothetical protein [Deltaproteobacteria bacterium]
MSGRAVVLAPVVPLWAIGLLFALSLGAVVFQYALLRKRLGRSRSLRLCLLRLGALSTAISIFLDPTFTARVQRKTVPSLAVLVDTSPSMGLPGRGGGQSRLEEAKRLLLEGEKALLGAVAARHEVRVYALDEPPREVDGAQVAALKPQAAQSARTEVAAALRSLASPDVLPLLLTDGSGGGARWTPRAGLPAFGAVPVGDPKAFKDVRLRSLKAPVLAFRGRPATVEAVVSARGYGASNVTVSLGEGQKILSARSVRLGSDPGEVPVSFTFTPPQAGRRHFTLSVSAQAGESSLGNNALHFSTRVAPDKLRVLMLSGHPSPGYRSLRSALKSEPTVDLLSFVMLRTPSDMLNVPPQEQSLIPFPVETLFAKELPGFDLLLLDDFPLHLYVKPAFLKNVGDFVNAGGGLAVLGGPDFLDGGAYAGTPLEEVLPVAVAGKDDYRRGGPWRVKVARAGRTHPLTRLDADPEESANLWRELAPLEGVNALRVKTSAAVLLEGGEGGSQPLLAVGRYGRGRTLVLGTDFAWAWQMGGVAGGSGSLTYRKFVGRAIRWLTGDPSLEAVQVELGPDAGLGRRVEVRVRAEPGSRGISFSVTDPGGRRIPSELKPAAEPGEYTGSFRPEAPGIYHLKAEGPGGSAEEEAGFYDESEVGDGFPDHERLRAFAAAAGGRVLTPGENLPADIARLAEERSGRWFEERRSPLWAHPLLFAGILLLLGGEWYLRRRWGLS